MINIEHRTRVFVWDDPLRRCYNGAFGPHHHEWSEWAVLDSNVKDPEKKLKFWRELNDYAVSQRGKEARCEFRAVEMADELV